MAKTFSVRDMLGKQSLPKRREEQTIVYRDPCDLVPTQENFYNTKNIDKLKASIKITGYLMQPILIENVNGKDQVLAGHRRRLCCMELLEEGDTRFEKVPCMYAAEIKISEDQDLTPEQKEAITPFLRQFKVIQANNYRDKNDWERMQEALEMEKIVRNLKEKVGITGTVRENLKDLLGVSNAQFGRYKNISNHLITQLMEEFQDGGINISAADAAASLNPDLQKQAYEIFLKNKILTLPDIQMLKDQQELNRDIPGQMTIEQATRQQKPEEDHTSIPVDLQIERFFESLKKNTTARIRNGDRLMGIKMISMIYCYVKQRNGYLNYQGHPDRITFNPDSPEETELTWQELTEELIRRYSVKKPVKMITIDAPEKPAKKKQDTVIQKKSCQPAAETPDEKQQEDRLVETDKMPDHIDNSKEDAGWPIELKDIPKPSEVQIIGYLYDEERKLREILESEEKEPGFSYMAILKQQLIVGGLRLIKKMVEESPND